MYRIVLTKADLNLLTKVLELTNSTEQTLYVYENPLQIVLASDSTKYFDCDSYTGRINATLIQLELAGKIVIEDRNSMQFHLAHDALYGKEINRLNRKAFLKENAIAIAALIISIISIVANPFFNIFFSYLFQIDQYNAELATVNISAITDIINATICNFLSGI